ncbi:uncharacterized protein LOC123894567 [Trifolium pratense]|nr:uncharacterized protein LOC123894567 [Trifolium pratense]
MPPRNAPDPVLDNSSPYFVHPGDGPSSVVVTPLLTGSNYQSWACSMKRALGAKMKLEFFDGSLPMPEDDFYPAFLVFLENAIDIWNDLRERFSQGDLIRISELQQEIHALKQENRFVIDFYSDLRVLWEELELYLPFPTCTCRQRCACEAMRSAHRNHTLLQTIRFITGLNDNFSTVKSQILLIDPLPSINKVFHMVIQHERQGNFSEPDESKILVNAAKSNKAASGSKPPRNCTYCGKDNHFVENCFKKNGVPPHMKKFASANAATEGVIVYQGASSEPIAAAPPSMSQEQYDKLMSLLQNSNLASTSASASSVKVGSSMVTDHTSVIHKGISHSLHNACVLGTWIIDLGASHHICSSLSWFQSYIEINPINITLPNGNFAIAKLFGTVQFSPQFVITNVLFVPNFSINLIAVSKLCQSPHYIVNFTNSHCIIHDKKNLKMIGSADEHDGLYHLKLTNKVAHVASIDGSNHKSIPKSALWHFRLGHPSHLRLASLHNKFPYVIADPNGICDICHLAKHKKLPYVIPL